MYRLGLCHCIHMTYFRTSRNLPQDIKFSRTVLKNVKYPRICQYNFKKVPETVPGPIYIGGITLNLLLGGISERIKLPWVHNTLFFMFDICQH